MRGEVTHIIIRIRKIFCHVAGWEDLGWDGEPFIVDESAVSREESHE